MGEIFGEVRSSKCGVRSAVCAVLGALDLILESTTV